MPGFVDMAFIKRRSNWLKVTVLALFFWWIIVFGFNQEYESEFGEHLDRNQIESFNMVKRTKTHSTTTQSMEELSTLETLSQLEEEIRNVFEHKIMLNDTRATENLPVMTSNFSTTLQANYIEKPENIFGIDNLGELGQAVVMPEEISPEIKKIFDDGWKKNSFNQYISDLISVNRSLPDLRTNYCLNIAANYSKNLPKTSVIIIFHNEAWSTLLRSFHSVLNRSPDHLITEVILVDDFSDLEHLKKPLDDYIKDFPKVKILRADKREGLIRARLRGTEVAKGPVLTFLDSHVECTDGWLEPLLDRIAENPTNVVCPIIEIISDSTLEFKVHTNVEKFKVGGFDWGLIFKWHSQPQSEQTRKKDPSEPTRSPTMAGGLFSIDKKFFEKLGTYDPDFDIWGAENLEISFKTWMCGGTLEIIPCSRVGHIFRSKSPYKWRPGVNANQRNSFRLAEVWLDDYKKFYHTRMGSTKIDFGDVSSRVKLRKELNCKSFEWFLKNIYPELEIPSELAAYGEIRNLGFGRETCLDISNSKDGKKEKHVSIFNCHGKGHNQYFEFHKGLIKRDDKCVELEGSGLVFKQHSHFNYSDNQIFHYDNQTLQFLHKSTQKCLTISQKNLENKELTLENCNSLVEGQKWILQNFNSQNVIEA